MAATILPDLSAPESDMVPACRAEARVVEDACAWNDKLYRLPRLTRGDSGEDSLHLQGVFLAEPATRKGRDHLDAAPG